MHGLLLKHPENPDCRQRIDQFVAPAVKDDPEVVVACYDIRDSQLAYVIPWETLHPAPVEVHHLPLLSVRSSVRPKTQLQRMPPDLHSITDAIKHPFGFAQSRIVGTDTIAAR